MHLCLCTCLIGSDPDKQILILDSALEIIDRLVRVTRRMFLDGLSGIGLLASSDVEQDVQDEREQRFQCWGRLRLMRVGEVSSEGEGIGVDV